MVTYSKQRRDAVHDIDGFQAVQENRKNGVGKVVRLCVYRPGVWRGRGRRHGKTPKKIPKKSNSLDGPDRTRISKEMCVLTASGPKNMPRHERTAEINANEEINAVAVSRGTPTPAKVCACRWCQHLFSESFEFQRVKCEPAEPSASLCVLKMGRALGRYMVALCRQLLVPLTAFNVGGVVLPGLTERKHQVSGGRL